ncbi:MAG: autotransporter domain-containing protein, partial [Proteobacteria bacterium]|nr:autotransporter domain-containing protein [Pseudomonadota bacterium]
GTEFRRMAGVNVTEGGTPPALTLALSDTSVDEGDAFVLSADVSRQSAQPLPLMLNITTPPGFSVTDGAVNYGGSVVQQVEFPARTTSHEFARFRLVEDTVNADDGVFSVRATQTTGDTSFVLATPNWLNITLVDNDDDPVVGLAASTTDAGPGEVVTFTIDSGGMRSTGARQIRVAVKGGAVAINNGSHVIPHDPLGNATTIFTVALLAGGVDAEFMVTARDSEDNTTPIVVTLLNGTGYTLRNDREAAVGVRAKPRPIVYVLGFDRPAYSIMEGETARVGFTITPPPPRAVFVNYATADGSGRAGQHYQRTDGRVRFAAGEGSKVIAVPTIQNHVASNASLNFTIHANVIVNGLRLVASRNITISDEDEMPVLSLQAAPRVRVGGNATVRIESNRTVPPQDRMVMVEINGTSVEAVYSSAQGSLSVGSRVRSANGSLTEGVTLPKEHLSTAFVVQAKDADNLTPIVVRLLNGTGYMLHPDPRQQQAVILVQQRSGLAARDVSVAILPQVVGVLLDETASAVAGRSRAFFGDGDGDGNGNGIANDQRWRRLTIGGGSVRSFAEAYARGEAAREANENPWDVPNASRLTQLPDTRLLRFNLAFRGGGADGFAVWGQGFSRGLSGKYSDGGVEFDGDVPGRIIGIERRVRQSLLLGVGFSDISAKFDYTRRDDVGDISRGRHETDLRGYHPYLAWRLRGGGHVWATLGVSDGEVVIRQNGVVDVYRSEVEAETASIGFNTLADGRRQADGSAVSLNFQGDVSYASISETPTQATRDAFLAARAIDLSVARVRIGGVISKHSVLDSGSVFRQSLSLTLRHDSGDVLEGGAVELGASASLELVRGLTIDLSVRTLLFHEESLDESGLRGRIAWATPHADGRGLQLVLAPRWGNTESSSDALLDGGVGAYHYYAEAGSDGNDDARYAFDIRYGIPVFRGGLLTPFITGDAGDIAGASYGSLFTYGDFTAGVEAIAGDEGKAFSRYSRDF